MNGMENIRAASLFSGAGGMDAGFEKAGFDIVFANEYDRDAAETWRMNRPGNADAMVEGDIRGHMEELPEPGRVDVVFGGPPCQGFSIAGKMNPDDARSEMVWVFMDAVEITRPKVFVMENVPALGVLSRWKDVRERLLARGSRLGYGVSLKVHHAFEYGVPENRSRVIFIGVREDIGNVEPFYSELEKLKREPVTAREAVLSAGRYGSAENPATCTAKITPALRPVMRASPYAGMLVNGAGRPVDLDGLAPTLPASMGGNKTPIVDETALNDPSVPNWFETYHAELKNGTADPSSVVIPDTVRRLTVRECASIQTFPEGYLFSGSMTKRYRQIGNAVPCLFAEAAASAVKHAYL